MYNNGKIYKMFDKAPIARMNDSGAASGLAFLTGELEKRDPKLYEPLTSVTWQRDVVAETGGGWIEYTSNYYVDYASTGSGVDGNIGGSTTEIPIMQANITKDNFKVTNWANILSVPFVDQQLLSTIGRSLDSILDKGIKLNWNKSLDLMTYVGSKELDVPGLTNIPDVETETVKVGVNNKTTWKDKTADEIVDDINSAILETWQASEYDINGMANHVLIDPANYASIVSRKVSEAGNISILQYILENNIAKNQDRDLMIFPSRWCTGAGAGGTNRMIAYVNNVDFISIGIPVNLGRVMTEASAVQMAYLTAYAGQIRQLRVNYYQTIRYKDGI